MWGTSNQYDLDVGIRKITCEGGIYEDLFFSHSENPYKILPTSDNWVLWSIVFCGNGMYKTILLSLPKCSSYFSLRVVVEQSVLGQLNYPFLLMVENLLIEVGAPGTDFTKPCFNHLAKREGF